VTHASQQFSPEEFRGLVNAWPPFVAQRVEVTAIGDDWSFVDVRMDLQPDNANFFGTAWGGTLFSMLDPFLPILIDRQLGGGYAVWDQSAEIDFLRPGRTAITSRVEVPPALVEEIRTETADGQKHLRWFELELCDADAVVVARQRRQIYVRRHRSHD
jgi:acyl-coenzyme A thioesterase PaaI-like protein